MQFAVIKTGGKQYLVKEGETLEVELLPGKAGDKLELQPLLVADGEAVKVGAPTVAGAKVSAAVVAHGRGDKIRVIKFHRKVRYKRTAGHRQSFTKIKIEKIAA
jgi:large subunit ribosomal protein L21